MILARYIVAQIIKSSLLVLITLVCLNLFFTMVQQLDDVGKGDFLWPQFIQYIALLAPGMAVFFMPMAVLLGAMLSLGSLASNSEIISMQAAGLAVKKLVLIVAQVALLFSVFSFLLDNLIVPKTESAARQLKSSSLTSRAALHSKRGLWIKDGQNIIFIRQLFPGGHAKNVEIYQLDEDNRLQMKTMAKSARVVGKAWQLQGLNKIRVTDERVMTEHVAKEKYSGQLSRQLLQSLVLDARTMSIFDVYQYMQFLKQNHLSYSAESLSFWRKIYFPLALFVMALLAVPFVLGSQRDSNTGQRLVIGIVLGLSYSMLDKLLVQAGELLHLPAMLNAFIPTLIFIVLTSFLLQRKISNPS